MKDLQVKLSEVNLQKLQKEMDHNGVREILAKCLPKSDGPPPTTLHTPPLFYALTHIPVFYLFFLYPKFQGWESLCGRDHNVVVQEGEGDERGAVRRPHEKVGQLARHHK